MNNEFKTLLLKIAKLPAGDQQWLLNQLTPKKKELFNAFHGELLLNEARKFRTLPIPELKKIQQMAHLPLFCNDLTSRSPLYVAIILEQGQFHWKKTFLESCAQEDNIQSKLTHEVNSLKQATKLALFKLWQEQLSFSEQMEYTNG